MQQLTYGNDIDWLRWENSFSPLFWEGIQDKEQEIKDDTPQVELRVVKEQRAVDALLGLTQRISIEKNEESEAVAPTLDNTSSSKNASSTDVLLKTKANLIEDDMVQEDRKKGNEKVDILSTGDLLPTELDNNSIQYVSEHHCQDGKLNVNLEIDSSLEVEKTVVEKGNKQDEYQKQGRRELEKKQMTLLKAKKSLSDP